MSKQGRKRADKAARKRRAERREQAQARTWADELANLPATPDAPFEVRLSLGNMTDTMSTMCLGATFGLDTEGLEWSGEMSREEMLATIRQAKPIGIVKLFKAGAGEPPFELCLDLDGIRAMRGLLKDLAEVVEESVASLAKTADDAIEQIPKVQYGAGGEETIH